ncbi:MULTISPECIES: sulfite exporter TauE/SafE family protein [Methylotenera]|uniref:sulfite exporter TauE/SafE family protein n=1 Tax=Methylotenera TaxID=359407 RepID=UPI00037AC010|nr:MULTISPECIES: sulfite exporter TauE/SafE family protein [Methylotenera]
MSIELIIAFVLLGIFVGILAGMLGIGGGGVMVPVLTSIFIYQGFPKDSVVHLALGTSMACIALTSFSSMRAHHKNGAVIWPLVKTMSIGMVVGTFSGTFLTAYLSSITLSIIFAAFMGYVAVQMFRTTKIKASSGEINKTELRLVTLGIGATSALVSIGGGSLTVPYLTWRGINVKSAIGISAALGFYISIAGTFGYLINGFINPATTQYSWGYIYLPAVLLVSIPSYFTAPLGAKLTQRLPTQILKKIFGVLLLILSLKMLSSFL